MQKRLALVCALVVIAGCGSGTTASSESGSRSSTTAAAPLESAPTTAAPTTAAPVEATVPPTEPPATAPPTTVVVEAPASLMPDVVGMNLQAAQDLIQEQGVFFSRSFDATGQNRSQVIDSNWTVVCQVPPPGTPIDEAEANLGAVKYGESGSC